MKLSHALEGFFLDKRLTASNATLAKYAYVFQRFTDFLGDAEIEHVTSGDVRRFLNHLRTQHLDGKRRQLSKRTLHDYWAPLSSFWTWAEKELEIPHIIRGKVQAPDFTKRTIEPFTADEIHRLVNATDRTESWRASNGKRTRSSRPTATRDKAIVLTLLDTGIRASELCALRLNDYDSRRGRLHIRHGKGDKERYVIVGARARKALWRYFSTRTNAKPNEPLFTTREGNHMRRDNLRHLLVRLGGKSSVIHAHPHRFRHTFAIEFLRNGGTVLLLKELLGHEKLEMVFEYVRIADRDIDGSARHSPVDNWKL